MLFSKNLPFHTDAQGYAKRQMRSSGLIVKAAGSLTDAHCGLVFCKLLPRQELVINEL